MTLQARLTLWSIFVMAAIVIVISLSDLGFEINRHLEYSLERSGLALRYSIAAINRELARSPKGTPVEKVAQSPALRRQIEDFTRNNTSDEIVVTSTDRRVLLDTAGVSAAGSLYRAHGSLTETLKSGFVNEWKMLALGNEPYEVAEASTNASGRPEAVVHVLVFPARLRDRIGPMMREHAWVSLFSVAFAVLGAFAFSSIAFQPIGELNRMIEKIASGEYELQQSGAKADELGAVATKVSLLGKQLKGAQSEFIDLKGNFEKLLDELEDAVLIFGRDRKLIAAAGAVDELVGKPRLELVGFPATEIFPPGTGVGLLLAQAMQLGRPLHNRSVPIEIQSNGTQHMGAVLLSVEFLGEQGMLVRLRDPETTRQIGRQLQTADRLSAINSLTSGVAHEVKNPLNAMLMHVELAKLKLSHGDYDLGPQMEVLTNEILRLDRVVKTFLDFTRPVELNLSETVVQDFVNDLADLARPQAEASNIEMTVEAGEDRAPIVIDPDLFKQAALNIVVNAIEAMPHGGELKLWSGIRNGAAEIRISDTGGGIPLSVRDKIYNLYYTTKEKGSGIGLSMTFRIVQLHDGAIDFDSEMGRGTTFSIRLPITADEA